MTTTTTTTKTTNRLTLVILGAATLACAKTSQKTAEPAPSTNATNAAKADVTKESFRAGLEEYLHRRGDLCVDKSTWPLDVTELDRLSGSRDARQMPVLARLGVVTGRVVSVRPKGDPHAAPTRVTRYELTPVGRQSFIDRRTRKPIDPNDPKLEDAPADFCMARLSLADVVSWQLRPNDRSPTEATVSYTYEVDAPAWAHDPEIERVFPAVGRVIRGARSAQLTERFALTPSGWVANELVARSEAVAARASAPGGERRP